MTEKPAESPRKKSVLKVKEADGTWRTIESSRVPSGDPEIDKLWEMPFSELEAIIEDNRHPLHEKALTVSEEIFQPIRTALNGFDFSSFLPVMPTIMPPIQTSWLAKVDDKYPEWQQFLTAFGEDEMVPSVVRTVDFDVPDYPAATVAEVAEATEDKAQEIRAQQLDVLKELLAQARDDSAEAATVANDSLGVARDALEASKGARTAGWWAAGAALAAVVATVIGIIVTVNLP